MASEAKPSSAWARHFLAVQLLIDATTYKNARAGITERLDGFALLAMTNDLLSCEALLAPCAFPRRLKYGSTTAASGQGGARVHVG